MKCSVVSVYTFWIKSACAVTGDVWDTIPGTAYAILSCVAPLAGLCALIRAGLVLVYGRKKTPRPGSLGGVCYLIALRSSARKMNGAKMIQRMQPIKTPP